MGDENYVVVEAESAMQLMETVQALYPRYIPQGGVAMVVLPPDIYGLQQRMYAQALVRNPEVVDG